MMHSVMRRYSGKGAVELFELLNRRKADIEKELRGQVPGIANYMLIKTADGGVTITTCKDKAGADTSVKVAADWVKANSEGITANPPEVTEGEVLLYFS